MRKLYFLILSLLIAGVAYSQCENSISLSKVAIEEDAMGKTGTVEVRVNSSDEFTCLLMIEKGSGPQRVAIKKGVGSSTIRFEGLELNQIYSVEVEFLSDRSYCRKLQKSPIIFEAD